ncbi:hypothetical protein JD77_04714 [Micromonospora olivasterospora]|uniref:Uncharacterized protein n=2 Tax=Micromonospora olivasterospora TaxID=1880 RepID=A0A562IFF9_MICOL|nr:hypothetical protein JD77_04714 [Micromonospora olivasterospora]
MPGPVLLTAVVFVVLAVLFALATLHRLVDDDGSIGAAVFFAAMAVACAAPALGLSGRRPWAPVAAYVPSGLLATASLGTFGAITLVGLGLLAWVLWALNARASRDWLAGPRRPR